MIAKRKNTIIIKGRANFSEKNWQIKPIIILPKNPPNAFEWVNICPRKGLSPSPDICLTRAESVAAVSAPIGIKNNKLISLVNTKLFPGSSEFDSVLENLPSIIIYPLDQRGLVIVGGCSERCFSKSDEKWIVGWSKKIVELMRIS